MNVSTYTIFFKPTIKWIRFCETYSQEKFFWDIRAKYLENINNRESSMICFDLWFNDRGHFMGKRLQMLKTWKRTGIIGLPVFPSKFNQ